jgi:hypothetical protein
MDEAGGIMPSNIHNNPLALLIKTFIVIKRENAMSKQKQ